MHGRGEDKSWQKVAAARMSKSSELENLASSMYKCFHVAGQLQNTVHIVAFYEEVEDMTANPNWSHVTPRCGKAIALPAPNLRDSIQGNYITHPSLY